MKPVPMETFDVTLAEGRVWPAEGLNIAAMPPTALVEKYWTTMVGGGVFQVREQLRSITVDAQIDTRPVRPVNVLWRLYVNKQLVSEGVGSSGLFLDALPGDRVQLFVKVPPETKRVVASLNGFEIPASVA